MEKSIQAAKKYVSKYVSEYVDSLKRSPKPIRRMQREYEISEVEKLLRQGLSLSEIAHRRKTSPKKIREIIENNKDRIPVFFIYCEKQRANEAFEAARLKVNLYSNEAVEKVKVLMSKAEDEDIQLKSASTIGRWAGLEKPQTQTVVFNLDTEHITYILNGLEKFKELDKSEKTDIIDTESNSQIETT